MTNLDSILKIRDITLPTKVQLVKAMAFPVVVYGCESWTVKKAEFVNVDTLKGGKSEEHNYWKKSRDIILPTKVRLVKAMVFPVVMYGCENWTVKKAEHRRIDTFELW